MCGAGCCLSFTRIVEVVVVHREARGDLDGDLGPAPARRALHMGDEHLDVCFPGLLQSRDTTAPPCSARSRCREPARPDRRLEGA